MAMYVSDKYRKNRLSLIPGGYTVVVEYITGRRFEYDKVKDPDAYIKKLKRNKDVKDAWIKN